MNKTILDIISEKPVTGRHSSQIYVFNELFKRFDLNPITIVETGCIRNSSNSGDGWGTVCWNIWAKATYSTIYSVDLSRESIFSCQKVIGPSPFINYIFDDSVRYLKTLKNDFKINLLFLDSLDYYGSEEEKRKSSLHQLEEIKAAEKNLTDRSLILIDDVFDTQQFKGKGELSIPYLLNKQWRIINYSDTQILLSK